MNRKLKPVLSLAVVVFGAIVFSTVGIRATDMVATLTKGVPMCGVGAVPLSLGGRMVCFDQYEASPATRCSSINPSSKIETEHNITIEQCLPESKPEVLPWRFVTYTEAKQLCARAGKRLPTNAEWYQVALGQIDSSGCALVVASGQPQPTGKATCKTASAVYDLVGNAWEWVAEVTVDGMYNGRAIPESGYVSLVDADGVVLATSATTSSVAFGQDYAWTSTVGTNGIMRGGFYSSDTDGGLFAQNLAVPLDFTTNAVGFRCVRDL